MCLGMRKKCRSGAVWGVREDRQYSPPTDVSVAEARASRSESDACSDGAEAMMMSWGTRPSGQGAKIWAVIDPLRLRSLGR